jgi:hypothetical protein
MPLSFADTRTKAEKRETRVTPHATSYARRMGAARWVFQVFARAGKKDEHEKKEPPRTTTRRLTG